MPPGRWLGLGGTCAPSHAPSLQRMLPIRGQSHRGRGYFAGSFPAGVPDTRELPLGARRICHLDDERHEELADRPLPADEARPLDGFPGRRHACGGKQGILGAAAGPTSAAWRIGRASAIGFDAAFPRIARGGDSAGPAAAGVRGDSTGAGGAGRNGEVANQPWADRTGAHIATNGCETFMKTRAKAENLIFVGAEAGRDLGVES